MAVLRAMVDSTHNHAALARKESNSFEVYAATFSTWQPATCAEVTKSVGVGVPL